MLPRTNASLRQPPLYARRTPPATSVVLPLEKARSSSSSWEARAKASRIVTSSSSVRVGAAAPPKSGCLRCWKESGRASRPRQRHARRADERLDFRDAPLLASTRERLLERED